MEGSCYNSRIQLHAYASSGAGNVSCCKNYSVATEMACCITFDRNAVSKTTANDVSWMDTMFLSNNKVSKCKSELFEHAQSMSKQPAGSAYVGNFINYLLYLPDTFPRGL